MQPLRVYDKFAHQTFFSFGEDKDEAKKMRICHTPTVKELVFH
jgi:hypothetical protein